MKGGIDEQPKLLNQFIWNLKFKIKVAIIEVLYSYVISL